MNGICNWPVLKILILLIMKKIINALLVVIVTVSLTNMSCTEEHIDQNPTFTPPPPPPPPPPLGVDARMNITIESPVNFAFLNGESIGAANAKWEKITGPASYLLMSPDSAKTKVTNLEKGIYTFKLSATNSTRTVNDTMTLIVQDPTSVNKQIFFWNLNWSCVMECGIPIGDVLSYLPPNTPFTLYLRREFSSVWELIVPESSSSTARFVYFISGNQFSIYDTSNIELSDHPEIKIVF